MANTSFKVVLKGTDSRKRVKGPKEDPLGNIAAAFIIPVGSFLLQEQDSDDNEHYDVDDFELIDGNSVLSC